MAWTGVGLAQSGLLNYPAAVEALEKARRLNPALAAADPTATYALGNSLVALQRYDEAWEVLKDLPDTDDMLLAKALALQGQGKAPEALQMMERIAPPLGLGSIRQSSRRLAPLPLLDTLRREEELIPEKLAERAIGRRVRSFPE